MQGGMKEDLCSQKKNQTNKKNHKCADPQHPSDVYIKVQETTSKQEQEVV